ncbi:MAG: DUF1858 domain-containing protein [Candidatus Abyssobacteria bacterium SURF_5]|uniref:DUF1858 domain-containing protein n=1 Tax=Abyssobacteria bacterium (strain SURF_5) TaxID=2093360 RepID=A0A3A4NW24_ABYX5|nr:MAG: DUF1858 domain-containing protein [Candidatus Abyssubacteria bacterium SURF_5]
MMEKKIDSGWLIGEVLQEFPETLPVFEKYFGETCITYPGAHLETIEFGSVMHSLDTDEVLSELNRCITDTKPE